MQAYRADYKRYRKTYHVLRQLRSVALEHKPIPSVAALVEVMFEDLRVFGGTRHG